MAEIGLASGKAGLIQLLMRLSNFIQVGRRAEVKSLKQLADEKFGEIDKTHQVFVRLLRQLRKTTATALERLERTDNTHEAVKQLEKTTKAIQAVRLGAADRRREQYEEAKVYEENMVSSAGILVKIPPEVAVQLMTFMASFCTYFELEGIYNHELKRALVHAEAVVDRYRNAIERKAGGSEKETLRRDLSEILTQTRGADDFLRAGWASIAMSYHRLNLRFREYGLS
ncbi:MAG: hypothetical protein ACHQAY_03490 [Hyphomicrobiales bacterium]